MHELSIASAILNTAVPPAEGRPVDVVALRVGTLRQVVPRSLHFYWDIVSRDTVCDGSRLEISEIRARMRCGDCEAEWEPDLPFFRCPTCSSAEARIVAGEELEVDDIELKEVVHA